MNIALTIPTGRPNVKKVIGAFLGNAITYGYDLKNFAVYLSIDTAFKKTRTRDYRLPLGLEKSLGHVEYISSRTRSQLGKELITELGADPTLVRSLFTGRGYSRQRNSALLSALKDGHDIAICFDDDEAPVIPVKDENGALTWQNPDYFGPHIMMLSQEADVTRGPCLGYLSPIPSDLEREVPERIRRRLGEALNPGNEVINDDSFINILGKVHCLSMDELYNSSRPFAAANTEYGKTIWAGNMGINLNSVRAGRVPIFYTPPGARGEDTFFSIQLKDASVMEVPSYIFHDPFGLYPRVLNGKFPDNLKNVPVTQASKVRFAEAVLGWIKYAPLLIHMTSEDQHEREERIGEMMEKIETPTRRLAEILECPRLNKCREVLQEYHDNVLDHYDTLVRSQKLWKEVILPHYAGVRI